MAVTAIGLHRLLTSCRRWKPLSRPAASTSSRCRSTTARIRECWSTNWVVVWAMQRPVDGVAQTEIATGGPRRPIRKSRSLRRLQLTCQPPHGVGLDRIDRERDFLDTMTGAAFKSPLFETAAAG